MPAENKQFSCELPRPVSGGLTSVCEFHFLFFLTFCLDCNEKIIAQYIIIAPPPPPPPPPSIIFGSNHCSCGPVPSGIFRHQMSPVWSWGEKSSIYFSLVVRGEAPSSIFSTISEANVEPDVISLSWCSFLGGDLSDGSTEELMEMASCDRISGWESRTVS